jgi:hypothetical protein
MTNSTHVSSKSDKVMYQKFISSFEQACIQLKMVEEELDVEDLKQI